MKIELALYEDHVGVIFVNDTDTELRFWELYNPWGWWTVSFQVRGVEDGSASNLLHSGNMEWSGIGSGPTSFVVAFGERREFPINLNHIKWMRDHRVARLKDKALQIRVRYEAEPMSEEELRERRESIESRIYPPNIPQEAIERHKREMIDMTEVFVGAAESEWVNSDPPHDWLFGDQTASFHTITSEQLAQMSPEEAIRRVCEVVHYLAGDIESHAEHITLHLEAQTPPVEDLDEGVTVGHLVTNTLEYARQIHRVAAEAQKYLENKKSQ